MLPVLLRAQTDKQCNLSDSTDEYKPFFSYQTHLFIFDISINRYVQIQVTSALSLQNSNNGTDNYLKIYKLTTNMLLFFVLFLFKTTMYLVII